MCSILCKQIFAVLALWMSSGLFGSYGDVVAMSEKGADELKLTQRHAGRSSYGSSWKELW